MLLHRCPHRPLLLALALLLGCGEPELPPAAPHSEGEAPADPAADERSGPPHARWDMVDLLRETLTPDFSPSDGGGRAWLVDVEPERPRAATPARFTLAYEVGPEGIEEGGMIYLQVSPFWEWSTPQTEVPEAPGFTTVATDAEGVRLDAATVDQLLLEIRVEGRALIEGERVDIVYGAGPAAARVDRFAESRSRLWFAVDGDGDGKRKVLADSPVVEVRAGPPARLRLAIPSVARPGEEVQVHIAVLDAVGNRGVEVSGEVRLSGGAPVLELPESVELEAADAGVKVIRGRVLEAGVVRLEAEGPGDFRAVSNPMLASTDAPRVLWADLHGHSSLSDGTGTPEDYFLYARDVAGLDVVALTDHDHWGILALDMHPEFWQEIRGQALRFHEPGRFVTLLGYEWTSWIYGHRHVLWFDGEGGEIHSSLRPETESPQGLWRALEGQPALTFAHHSAGGPVPTDWSIPPDPRFEPVTEIVSVHGSSEAPDSPQPIYSAVAGNWARDALDRGYRLGFVGSGDGHDGHPGLAQLGSPGGGLAAILAEELTRESVLAALRARRSYATNGARMLLRFALGEHRMGSIVAAPADGSISDDVFIQAVGSAPLERVDLVRSGELIGSMELDGRQSATLQHPMSELQPGEYIYIRVLQQDGGVAWSSPIFVE